MRPVCWGIVLCCLAGSGLSAQEAPVEQGQFVRVTSGDSRVVGQLGTSARDTLVVLVGGRGSTSSMAVFPLSTITRLEVHHENTRREGAWQGAKIGAVLGLLSGFFSDAPTGSDGETMSRWIAVPTATLSAAAFGAAIGAAFRGSRWRQVPLPVQ